MNFTISIRKESKLRVFSALGKDYRLRAQPRFRHVAFIFGNKKIFVDTFCLN